MLQFMRAIVYVTISLARPLPRQLQHKNEIK